MAKYWKAISAGVGGLNGALIVALADTDTPGVVTKAEAITILGVTLSAALATLAGPKNAVKDGEV